MQTKILFIYYDFPGDQVGFALGVGILAGELKKKGYSVKGLHITSDVNQKENLQKIVNDVADYSPNIIAYSTSTYSFPPIAKMAQEIRQHMDTVSICGGPHPTLYPNDVLSAPGIDYICMGEGERPLLDFVAAVEAGEQEKDIPGIWSLDDDGQVIRNKMYPLIQDLDAVAWPDYEVFGEKYADQAIEEGWVRVISSRGCPYSCTYCHNVMFRDVFAKELEVSKGSMGFLRMRSVDSMIEEIKHISSKHEIKVVNYIDDLFGLKKSRILEFCDRFKKEIPESIGFSVQTHFNYMDEESITALRDARCLRVQAAVESGSQRVLDLYKRPTSPQKLRDSLKIMSKAAFPLGTWTQNILGAPFETIEEMKATVAINAENMIERTRFNMLSPYPGSPIHDYCLKHDLFTEDDNVLQGEKVIHGDRLNTRLKFPDNELAFLEKFNDIGHWYLNYYSPFGLQDIYAPLIEEIEEIPPGEWEMNSEKYQEKEKEVIKPLEESNAQRYGAINNMVNDKLLGLMEPWC